MENSCDKFNNLFDCSCQGNCVQMTLAGQRMDFGAEVGENNCYEIYILQCAEEEDNGCNFIEREIYRYTIDLTNEEWEAAQEFTFEDIEFETRIDGLLAARVARDILNYCVRNIKKTLYYTSLLVAEQMDIAAYEKKWEKYFKELLHKRMNGELIAPYIPGYEPKK